MNEIDEREEQMTEEKHDRRSFFKQASKYLLGIVAFGIASLFGLRRNGDLRLGKMIDTEIGLSEAHGACSYGSNCAGGGGQCSYGSSCGGSGGGSGQCSYGSSCAGGVDDDNDRRGRRGSGSGSCSYGSSCAGGGGSCSYGSNCAGGGGQCSYGSNCAGN